MTLSAVLFDAGNTLVYAHPGRMAEIFRAAGAPATPETVRTAERAARRLLHDAVRDGHAGTEPEVWGAYFAALLDGSGVPDGGREAAGRGIRDVHASDHLWTWVEPGTAEALQTLRDDGLRLGVISNADGRMEAVLEEVGLRPFFEFVVDSERVGVEKPDPRIFREGCRLLDLPPEACLYVGDLYPVDYVGATGAGLQAVLLDPLGVHADRAPTIPDLQALPAYVRGLRGSGTGG